MKSRIVLYSFIAGAVLIVMFYFVGKSLGKSLPPPAKDIPVDGPNGNQSPSVGEAEIHRITDKIKEDVYAPFYIGRNSEPYVQLMALSDSDFVRVYNDWSARYHKLNSETLRQACEGEFSSITSYTFQNLAPELIKRWTRLGLN